jgi:hypothetical protein
VPDDPAGPRPGGRDLSSEPPSGDPGWERVPPDHAVLIRSDDTATVKALQVAAAKRDP